jgi:hypothetical protein
LLFLAALYATWFGIDEPARRHRVGSAPAEMIEREAQQAHGDVQRRR